LLQNQEAVGGYRGGGVVVKPAPVAAFEMPLAKFLFQFFIVARGAPARFGNGNRFAQRDGRGQIG
jgi:hypothetical protein